MNLRELLRSRREWLDDQTIYVVEPWTSEAEAFLSSESPDKNGPIFVSGKPYVYFLEGFIARDFLDDLDAPDDVGEVVCDRLIRYTIDGA